MNAARKAEELGAAQREALSWGLAAQLARRHPNVVRIFHGAPGGGQHDVLWVRERSGDTARGAIALNRNGTLQVHSRFDLAAMPDTGQHRFTWAQVTQPRGQTRVLRALERIAGLPTHATPATPATTAETLTWRVLATLTAAASTTTHPVHVAPGYHDTSGGGAGPSQHYVAFPAIPGRLLAAADHDPAGIAGYRFWFVVQDEQPRLALEQSTATAWAAGEAGRGLNLAAAYGRHGRTRGLLSLVGALSASAHLHMH